MKPSYVSAEAASERGHLHVPHNVLLVLATHLPASPLYFLHPVVRPSVIAHSHLRRERAARRGAARSGAALCPPPALRQTNTTFA